MGHGRSCVIFMSCVQVQVKHLLILKYTTIILFFYPDFCLLISA
jgi:hypothetical protein